MIEIQAKIYKEKKETFVINVSPNSLFAYELTSEGKSVEEAIDNWYINFQKLKDVHSEDSELEETVFQFTYDVSSFLLYYGEKFSFVTLSKLTDIPLRQLIQYAAGDRLISNTLARQIQDSLYKIADEIKDIDFFTVFNGKEK